MTPGLSNRTRDKIHTVADHAREALDGGLALAGSRARTYANLGASQLERMRERLPERLQKPSITMVLTALGAGVLVGLLLSGKAAAAVGDISEASKDALRRSRLSNLPH